ncbi:MAG: TolC family protein [Bdellovibrio sp.]|nr:MAG: TolC family protein [Bdellovibrio sp.]
MKIFTNPANQFTGILTAILTAILTTMTFLQPCGRAEDAGAKLVLSQQDVAHLVLEKSDRTPETNLTAELARKQVSDVLKNYEWLLAADAGYDINQTQRLDTPYPDLKDTSWLANVSLKKPWTTGSTLTFEWSRNSLQAVFNPASPFLGLFPANQTFDSVGVTFEQSLWKNSLGVADRSMVLAAEKSFASARTKRGFNLQNLVLDGLRKYWSAYVTQENLRQAIHSRATYEKLVETVRKKTGYGYAGIGELPQAQAELESKVQEVKKQSLNYLQASDELLAYLNLPIKSEIDFKVESELSEPPKLKDIALEKTREFQTQVRTFEAAEAARQSATALNNPDLRLVAKAYGTSVDPNSSTSLGQALGGANPHYYIGVKLTQNFGSNTLGEDQLNKELTAQIEEIRLSRLKTDLQVRLTTQEEKVQSTFAVVLSARGQKTYREKALKELQAAYNQGRTEIRNLILAMNDSFTTETGYSRSVGDYQVALAEWAALRDELIPERETAQEK